MRTHCVSFPRNPLEEGTWPIRKTTPGAQRRKSDASERPVGTTTQHSEVLAGHDVWHSHVVMAAGSFLTSYSAPHKIPTTSEVSPKCMISIPDFTSRRRHCKYVSITEYSRPFRGDQHTVQHSGHGFKIIHNVRKEIKSCSQV